MSSTLTRSSHSSAPAAADGKLDIAPAPAASREVINDCLDSGNRFAEELRRINPQNGDQYDRQADDLTRSLHKLEILIEVGGSPQLVTRYAAEVSQALRNADAALKRVSLSGGNQLGIIEHNLGPDTSNNYTFSVKRGEAFAIDYVRRAEDNGIARPCEPQAFSGTFIRIDDPYLGAITRKPDPRDPNREVISIAPTEAMRGYMTIIKGGQRTHINVNNNSDNRHLLVGPNSHEPLPTEEMLQKASAAAVQSLRQEKSPTVQMPEAGSELKRGGELNVDAGFERVWLRYQGRTYEMPHNSSPVKIGGVTFTRQNGQLNIQVGENALPGALDLRVGDLKDSKAQVTHLVIHPKQKAAVIKPAPEAEVSPKAAMTWIPVDHSCPLEISMIDAKGNKTVLGTVPAGTPGEQSEVHNIMIKRQADGIALVAPNYANGAEAGTYLISQIEGDKKKEILRLKVKSP